MKGRDTRIIAVNQQTCVHACTDNVLKENMQVCQVPGKFYADRRWTCTTVRMPWKDSSPAPDRKAPVDSFSRTIVVIVSLIALFYCSIVCYCICNPIGWGVPFGAGRLWKETGPPKNSNYDLALKKMCYTKTNFKRKVCLEVIELEVQKYLDHKFVIEVASYQINHNQKEWYLPLRAVFSPELY